MKADEDFASLYWSVEPNVRVMGMVKFMVRFLVRFKVMVIRMVKGMVQIRVME